MGINQGSLNFNTNALNQNSFNQNIPGFNNTQSQQIMKSEIEKSASVEKPPLPEEHLHMKTVLDELKNQCSCAANNPVNSHSF